MRKGFFFILLLSLVMGFIYWNRIATFIVNRTLTHYAEKYFGGRYQGEDVLFRNGHLVILKPAVFFKDQVFVSAESIDIGYEFNFFKRDAALFIEFQDPTIYLKSSPSDLGALITKPHSNTFKTYLTTRNGKIVLHLPGDPLPTAVDFTLESHTFPHYHGTFTLNLGDSENHGKPLTMAFEESELSKIRLAIHGSQISCSSLLEILKPLVPSLKGLRFDQGVCDADLVVQFGKNVKPEIIGSLIFQHLIFNLPKPSLIGEIDQVNLMLLPHQNGSVTLAKGVVKYLSDTNKSFEVHNLDGRGIIENEKISLLCKGTCSHHQKNLPLLISGEALFEGRHIPLAHIDFKLKDPHDSHGIDTHLSYRDDQNGNQFASMKLENIAKEEFELVKGVLGTHVPYLDLFVMEEGSLEFSVSTSWRNFVLELLNLDRINGSNLHFSLPRYKTGVTLGNIFGHLAIDLSSSEPNRNLEGQLALSKVQAFCHDSNKQTLTLKDAEAKLSFQNGLLNDSIVSGEILGFKSSFFINESNKDQMIDFQLNGQFENLCHFLPDKISQNIQENLKGTEILVQGTLSKNDQIHLVRGAIEAQDNSCTQVNFSFGIEKTHPSLWTRRSDQKEIYHFWNTLEPALTQLFFPSIAQPALLIQSNWIKNEIGWGGYVIRDGHFHAKRLSADKYIKALFFPETSLVLKGAVNIEGHFDFQGISLDYSPHDLEIETDYFLIKIPGHKGSLGQHVFNFGSASHHGKFTVDGAVYEDKVNALRYGNVKTAIYFEDNRIRVKELETQSCRINFYGNILVDILNPKLGIFDVVISPQIAQGSVRDFTRFLSHFGIPSPTTNAQLEGEISLAGSGASFHFHFEPDDYSLHTSIEGVLKDGVFSPENGNISLADLSLGFKYDNHKSCLFIKDLKGNITLGKGDNTEHLILSGNHLTFHNFLEKCADFDLSIQDTHCESLRLVGRTEKAGTEEEIKLFLNHDLSHLMGIHPSFFELSFNKNGSQISALNIELISRLQTLLQVAQKFEKAGFLPIPEEIFDICMEGKIMVRIRKDPETSDYRFISFGKEMIFGNHKVDKFYLLGKKRENNWIIDQMQLDQLSLATDIRPLMDSWKVNFLGIRYGESVLMGLEGDYDPFKKSLHGRVKILEFNLEKLEEIAFLNSLYETHHPKGSITGNGEITLEFLKNNPASSWRADCILNLNLLNLWINGIQYQDAHNISCHMITDRFLILRNIESGFIASKEKTAFTIGKLTYDFSCADFAVEDLKFKIPFYNLPWIASKFHESFPEFFPSKMEDTVKDMKKEGALEGRIDFEMSPISNKFHLKLSDGCYYFYGIPYECKNMELEINPNEFKLRNQLHYGQMWPWMLIHSTSPTLSDGLMILSDNPVDQSNIPREKIPLTVTWSVDPANGFSVHRAEGYLSGLDINILRDPHIPLSSDFLNLTGTIQIDCKKAQKLFSKESSDFIKLWDIRDGYYLTGKWKIEKNSENTQNPNTWFCGEMKGDYFTINGYQFETLSSNCTFSPDEMHLYDLRVNDPAVSLFIDSIELLQSKNNQVWTASIPLIHFKDLRPSFLKLIDASPIGFPPTRTGKYMKIREITIEDVFGKVSEPFSFVGTGKLEFVNPIKKTLPHPLIAIPAEIIARLGLDLTVLNPVKGTIFFKIKNRRFVLTRFKDVYSEGKLSKFNLANTPQESYVDFDGNISIKIKMKQYNLLFKIAELFTVTVQGNYNRPTYQLQKQQKQLEHALKTSKLGINEQQENKNL